MRRGSRALAVLLAGAVGLGCGVRKALPEDAGADAAEPEVGPAAPEVAAEVPQPDAPKPRRACASDVASRVALATVQDDSVIYVMSDGSSRVVYRFPAAQKRFAYVSVVVAGGDVFATWTLWGPSGEETCPWQEGHPVCPEDDRLVRLDLDGHVLWEKQISGHASSVWIGTAARDELAAVLPPAPPAPAAPWQVVDDGDAVVRTNRLTGESERIVFDYPDGLRPLGAYAVDHEGSFAHVLRDDTLASAYLTHDGTTWTPLGKTLADVEQASVGDVAGTYVVTVRGTNSFFVPKQRWSAVPDGGTPGELRGDSVQLLRPATGLATRAVPELWLGITSDGLCAAYVEQAPDRFILHDLANDVRKPIAGAHAGGNAAFTMIE